MLRISPLVRAGLNPILKQLSKSQSIPRLLTTQANNGTAQSGGTGNHSAGLGKTITEDRAWFLGSCAHSNSDENKPSNTTDIRNPATEKTCIEKGELAEGSEANGPAEESKLSVNNSHVVIEAQKLHTNGTNDKTAPSPKPVPDFRAGSVEDVVAWAKSKGLHEKTIDALQRELVDGEALLTLTKDELTRHPYNLPGGPAASLALAIDGLRPKDTGNSYDGSVDSLLKIMTKHPKLRGHLKKDPSLPQRLALNKSNFKRVDRDGALSETYNFMALRHTLQHEEIASATKDNREPLIHDRLVNPLIAIQATTGGGKSYFLDELGALRSSDLELCSDSEMKGILQNSLTVAITYNADSKFDDIVDARPEAGLALRALHSYFIAASLPFRSFVDILASLIPTIRLSIAIECIMAHSNKGVLLLVDELMKSGAPTRVVSIIGGCLDSLTTKFNAVVTTLDALAFQKEETDSGRKIKWVKLEPAKLSSAHSLFEDSANFPVLALCIADCNGHFRSLETLAVMWLKVKRQPLTYPALIKKLREHMESKYGDILTIDLIKPALRGKAVSPSSSPDGIKTYRDYLSMGIYLNSIKGEEDFIPRLSPLLLMLFAERKTSSDADTNAPSYKCARVLLAMLEPNFDDPQYEKFHAYWEVLYRILFSGEARTLSSFYNSEAKNLVIDPQFTLSNKSVDLCLLPTYFPPIDKTALSSVDLRNQVLVPYLGNPGFDVVYSEEQRGKSAIFGPIIVCVECKFSIPKATTVLSLGDVEDKHKLVHDGFAPYLLGKGSLCGLKLEKENIYLIVCAFRKTFVKGSPPSNTIVLGREQLKKLYTPSLSSRPQFISSRANGVADDINKVINA